MNTDVNLILHTLPTAMFSFYVQAIGAFMHLPPSLFSSVVLSKCWIVKMCCVGFTAG